MVVLHSRDELEQWLESHGYVYDRKQREFLRHSDQYTFRAVIKKYGTDKYSLSAIAA